MRFLALTGATFAILYGALDLTLDFRGANWYVRPFHAVGTLVTAIAGSAVITFLRRWISRPALLTLCHLLTVLLIWGFLLPAGDAVAERIERVRKTEQEVGDTGYGWFYWDDSGMGNWPTTLPRLAWPNLMFPVWPVVLLTFSYSYFRVTHSKTIPE